MLAKITQLRGKGVPVRILAHKLDRLLRNYPDWAKLSELREGGMEIEFVTGSFPNNAQGQLALGMQVVIAKYYVDNLSEEVKKGLREKLDRGEWPGWAPLGYRNVNKRVEPDPVLAPLLRRAFEYCATGEYSLATLSMQLSRDGLVGRKHGKPISKSVLRDRILTNPMYCGLLRYGGRVYPGTHDPIIPIELFDRVQVVLGGKSRPRRFRHEFRFGGLFSCRGCGCAVVGDLKKGRYTYYRCSHRRGGCAERYVREESLGEMIQLQVAPVLYLPPDVQSALREAATALAHEEERGVGETQPALARRVEELAGRRSALLDLRLGGHIDDAAFTAKQNELTREEARAKQQLTAFEQQPQSPREAVERFIRTCNSLALTLRDAKNAELRQLLEIVGSNYQFGGKRIEFKPVKPFDLASRVRNRPNWRAGADDVRNLVNSLRLPPEQQTNEGSPATESGDRGSELSSGLSATTNEPDLPAGS